MNLTRLSISRPRAVLAIVCLVLLLGIVSLINIPVDLLPEFEMPISAIITSYESAAPAEVETHVTRPLEDVLGTIGGVQNISSTSQAGSSMIMLEFSWGTSLDFALLDVREKVDMVSGFLPDGAGDPQVFKFDPSMMPTIYASLYGQATEWELRQLADDLLKPRLERVDGVASVDVIGGRLQEVRVLADPELLVHYGLGVQQIAAALRSENYTVSAGTLDGGGTEQHLRVAGDLQDLDDIRNLVIGSIEGSRILLSDVAGVEIVLRDPSTISTFNGETSIGLQIYKQADANTVQVSRNVQQAMKRIENQLPQGICLAKVMDQGDYIMESIRSVVEMGAIGGLLAVLLLFLFLRSLRSSLVIALSIPLSIVVTFVLMYFTGVTINIISLAGLALGLGIMVDSSIVVLENIFRFREGGTLDIDAAMQGTGQVVGAITASTVTTVVVFLPIIFITGFTSQIFSALALTVTFSLLTSLLVALTVTPLLASRLLALGNNKSDTKREGILLRLSVWFQGIYEKVESMYRKMLPWALQKSGLVLGIFLLTFILTFVLIPFIGMEFIPPMDQGQLSVTITLPQGSSLNETERIAILVEEQIKEISEVDKISLTVGSGGLMAVGADSKNAASMGLILKDLEERNRSDGEIAEALRGKLTRIPGAEIAVAAVQDAAMMSGGAPLNLAVRGDDLDELEQLTEVIASLVAAVPGTREVSTSFQEQNLEKKAYVDRRRAADYGVGFSQIAEALRASLDGVVVTHYREAGKEMDVRLMLGNGSSTTEAIQELSLFSPAGRRVPIKEVLNFEEDYSPRAIQRYNQVRTASVSAELVGRSPGEVQRDVEEILAGIVLPEGYIIDFEGELAMMEDAFSDLFMVLILAILLVYLVMVVQFESLLHPLLVMFALPQTFTGAALALLITGHTLSVVSLIGIVMLMGIVVNNSIVLIDFINKTRATGKSIDEAILFAGPVRLRPILMTTLTTVLGMLPLALGIGSGAELWAPLASVVIGGLLFSTLLTLIVVPVAYRLAEGFTDRLRHKFTGIESVVGEADTGK